MERGLPSGTVTFLFSDVEGSTKLLHALGTESYMRVINDHRRVMRDAFQPRGGVEVGTEGDSFFVAFPTAEGALDAAREMTARFSDGPIHIRIGLHTGHPQVSDEGYFGIDIHLAARIAAAGHGGQVLVSGATAAAVGTDGLRDLGEHRLKDFDKPVAIYQVGDERFAPLKTISNTNLPRPASSFLGREREVEEVAALLQDGGRVLTLTGPGGTGKTRLAIQAAAAVLGEFKAGVFWVDLAPVTDPVLVAGTIGQVLGAQESLAAHIGEREMLLVIDNLEQVIQAAPELAELAERCPKLRLLVTSRERMRVRGEVEYAVPPLSDAEAAALFCLRAGVEADDAVGRLCRALDNMPLAIELAAARAAVLTPAQILDRLAARLDLLKGGRDADPRQQTLRATIEWSHDLLRADEQALFVRLGVFAGGWTLGAAEEVASAELDELQSLVDKSLVRHLGDRFEMLETIRAYAAERFQNAAEHDDVRARHATYYLNLAETALPHLRLEERHGGDRQWLQRQAVELDNYRVALDHLVAGGDPQRAIQLAGALETLWANANAIAEGRRRLDQVLALDSAPTAARARALDGAAELAHFSGETGAAQELSEEAIRAYRAVGDEMGVAEATAGLAAALAESGEWERARHLFVESLERFRALGDQEHEMWATRSLAWASWALGDLPQARALYEDALRQSRAAGARLFEAVVLGALSGLSLEDGRFDDARTEITESLRIKREVLAPTPTMIGLGHAATFLSATGHRREAARLIGAFDALLEDIGGSEPWVVRMREDTLAEVRHSLSADEVNDALEAGRKLPPDKAMDLSLELLERRGS
ncbi:MAG TPA: tetratricopeptide repeat protein [Candidatus Limnocylindria bacterium]|nr:tetratricopeptide repeat protein [Candidatus Limnocylindria bacterium]